MLSQKMQITRDSIRRLLRMSAIPNVKKILQKLHDADISLIFKNLNDQEQKVIFSLLIDEQRAAEFLTHLDPQESAEWLTTLPKGKVTMLLSAMSVDDRVDILSKLPEELAEEILSIMKGDAQEETSSFLEYGPDTAGGIMSSDFFALSEDTTVGQAIDAIKSAEDETMIFYIYVIDERNHLVGVVSLRQLLVTKTNPPLREIMNPEVIRVGVDMDQEDVARLVQRYDLVAMPVVDKENKLIGLVTVDDIIDVIREENTEDIMKMAGTSEAEVASQSGLLSYRLRLPWLFLSWIGGVVAVFIIGRFEENLQEVAAVAAFIPVIIGMGGNVGTQSSFVTVRGLALGKIDVSRVAKFVAKEVWVGILLGATYGVLLGLVAGVSFSQVSYLGFAVGFAICVNMVLASILGTVIPLFLHKISIDPAVATGPFVTTSMDVLGVVVYFALATLLLPGF